MSHLLRLCYYFKPRHHFKIVLSQMKWYLNFFLPYSLFLSFVIVYKTEEKSTAYPMWCDKTFQTAIRDILQPLKRRQLTWCSQSRSWQWWIWSCLSSRRTGCPSTCLPSLRAACRSTPAPSWRPKAGSPSNAPPLAVASWWTAPLLCHVFVFYTSVFVRNQRFAFLLVSGSWEPATELLISLRSNQY